MRNERMHMNVGDRHLKGFNKLLSMMKELRDRGVEKEEIERLWESIRDVVQNIDDDDPKKSYKLLMERMGEVEAHVRRCYEKSVWLDVLLGEVEKLRLEAQLIFYTEQPDKMLESVDELVEVRESLRLCQIEMEESRFDALMTTCEKVIGVLKDDAVPVEKIPMVLDSIKLVWDKLSGKCECESKECGSKGCEGVDEDALQQAARVVVRDVCEMDISDDEKEALIQKRLEELTGMSVGVVKMDKRVKGGESEEYKKAYQ